MTVQLTKGQRELELVSLMLTDRELLHREFQGLTGYDPRLVFDRDMIRLILAREYPAHEDWRPTAKPS